LAGGDWFLKRRLGKTATGKRNGEENRTGKRRIKGLTEGNRFWKKGRREGN